MSDPVTMGYRLRTFNVLLAVTIFSELVIIPTWAMAYVQTRHPAALLMVFVQSMALITFAVTWWFSRHSDINGAIVLHLAVAIFATHTFNAVSPDELYFAGSIALIVLTFAAVALRNGIGEWIWLVYAGVGYWLSLVVRSQLAPLVLDVSALRLVFIWVLPIIALIAVGWLSQVMTSTLRTALTSAQEGSQTRRQILTMLNHEFRTPLTYIVGYAILLRDTTADQRHDLIERVISGSTRLQRLIEGFLTLAAISYSEARLAYEMHRAPFTSWGDLLDKVMETSRSRWESKGLRVEQRVSKRLPPIVAYDVHLEVIISHLLDNAIKFTDRGRILVSVIPQDKGISLVVDDTGVGIPASQLDGLFTMFRQIDRERNEQQGAGIGLALVKGLAELHGGYVRVESQVNLGSRFSVWLPGIEHHVPR